MQEEGGEPNHITFLAALKACVSTAEKEAGSFVDGKLVKVESLAKGRTIHSQAARNGRLHIFVENCLVGLYAKCGSLEDARKVFEGMQRKDLLSWSEMILGYAVAGEGEAALKLYARMQEEGCEPNHVTYLAALKACVSLAEEEEGEAIDGKVVKSDSLIKGRAVHSQAAKSGDEQHSFVGSALVDMYMKCGSLDEARSVFERMQQRNTVSWNSMIQGTAENGEADQALRLYGRMRDEGFTPDGITYVAVLKACGRLGMVNTGRQIEAEVSSCVDLEEEPRKMVANCLVDFYGKCGCMVDAQRVFDSMVRRDLVSWNAMIDGFSRQGDCENALRFFEKLRRNHAEEGLKPNEVTFLAVLAVCSHAGLVEEGKEFFHAMVWEYGCVPELKHFTCVVDLLGRANRLDEALKMVRSMPYEPNSTIWTSLLAASCKWKNLEVGKLAFEALGKLETITPSAFVLVSDLLRLEEQGLLIQK